jgi:hypothetical protein
MYAVQASRASTALLAAGVQQQCVPHNGIVTLSLTVRLTLGLALEDLSNAFDKQSSNPLTYSSVSQALPALYLSRADSLRTWQVGRTTTVVQCTCDVTVHLTVSLRRLRSAAAALLRQHQPEGWIL